MNSFIHSSTHSFRPLSSCSRAIAAAIAVSAVAGCAVSSGEDARSSAQADTTESPGGNEFGDSLSVAGFVWNVALAIMTADQVDVHLTILQNLDQINAKLDQLATDVSAVRRGVDALNDAAVRAANYHSLDLILQGFDYVRNARVAMVGLATSPSDPNLRYQADSNSWNAVRRYTDFPEVFERVGNSANEVRFDLRLGYPAFVTALTVRLQWLKSQYTPDQIKTQYATELNGYATFVQSLIDRLAASVTCRAWKFGGRGPRGTTQCFVGVQCRDNVALAPEDPSAAATYDETLCIGGGKWDSTSWTEPAERSARSVYGGDLLPTIRDTLTRLASTGYPNPAPVPDFGGTQGPLVSTMNNKVVDTLGGSQPRSQLFMEPWTHASSQVWYFDRDGTIRSSTTGLCLDVKAGDNPDGTPAEQQTCWGGDNQIWDWRGANLVNRYSGKCLEILSIDPNDGARLGVWACWGGPNQQWTTLAPDTPRPR